MVPLLALLLAAACSGDPTDPLRGGVTRLDAAPSQIFLQLGESKTVDISALDEQGNQISSAYEVTDTTGGISVKRDSTFLPIFIDDTTLSVPPEAPIFRYLVTATGYGPASFTVATGGNDVTVPVQVVAQTVLEAQISNLTPALGEVVTITAPSGISFSATSTVTFAGATAQPAAVTVAPDGKSITFIPPPNIANAQATISDVVSDATPGITFSPVTADRITTPEVASFVSTFSSTTPAAAQTVTLSSPEATFDPATTLLVGSSTPIIISNDGNTITFLPDPGASGTVTVSGVILNSIPQFPLTLPATDAITVGTTFTPLTGTGAPATAPALTVPGPGVTTAIIDGGTYDYPAPIFGGAFGLFPSRLYKFDVAAGQDVTVTLSWASGDDLGVYWFAADGVTEPAGLNPADAGGGGATPESSTSTFAPGSYRLAVVNFGPGDPTFFSIRLDGAVTPP